MKHVTASSKDSSKIQDNTTNIDKDKILNIIPIPISATKLDKNNF